MQSFIIELSETGFNGIDAKHRPHKLIGNYKNCYECHVGNDLLLIWIEEHKPNIINLVRTGTHSDLF
jgi:mRNA interferase YafQ